jgi:DNA-binding NarL/FixJ family response regulator
MTNSQPIRLMIIDDHQLRRECLTFVLAREADLSVSVVASSLPEAFTKATEQPVDIVLMDAGRSEGSPLELVAQIRGYLPDVMIITTGLSEGKADILDFIEAGANGYVSKDASLVELLDIIHSVNANGAMLSPGLTYSACSRVAELIRKRSSINVHDLTNLTRREFEVIQLLADGLSNEQMAERLYLSPYTIKNHVHNILEKLQAHSRLEAVRLAYRKGLIKEFE